MKSALDEAVRVGVASNQEDATTENQAVGTPMAGARPPDHAITWIKTDLFTAPAKESAKNAGTTPRANPLESRSLRTWNS